MRGTSFSPIESAADRGKSSTVYRMSLTSKELTSNGHIMSHKLLFPLKLSLSTSTLSSVLFATAVYFVVWFSRFIPTIFNLTTNLEISFDMFPNDTMFIIPLTCICTLDVVFFYFHSIFVPLLCSIYGGIKLRQFQSCL